MQSRHLNRPKMIQKRKFKVVDEIIQSNAFDKGANLVKGKGIRVAFQIAKKAFVMRNVCL